jgi:ribose 5-phosphate isomerase B
MVEKSKGIISVGSDHGGFQAKEVIKKHLIDSGYEVVDCGTDSTASCNYAEFALKAAELVGTGKCKYGILFCSTGEGVTIAANKVKNVRCGIGYNDDVSRLLRQHNDANMISFGAKHMDINDILRRTDIFLNTDFEGGRHTVRVDTISKYEKK